MTNSPYVSHLSCPCHGQIAPYIYKFVRVLSVTGLPGQGYPPYRGANACPPLSGWDPTPAIRA